MNWFVKCSHRNHIIINITLIPQPATWIHIICGGYNARWDRNEKEGKDRKRQEKEKKLNKEGETSKGSLANDDMKRYMMYV